MFCAENLSSVHRFAEAEDVFKDLERSEPDLYIVSFERGKNLLNWGKAQAAMGEIQKALTLNPSFDQAWAAMGRAEFALGEKQEGRSAQLHNRPADTELARACEPVCELIPCGSESLRAPELHPPPRPPPQRLSRRGHPDQQSVI